jgi:hypothetical protein
MMKGLSKILLLLALVALVMVGCERKISGNVELVDGASENCLNCHSGLLDQAQGEWANSVHASGSNVDYTNRGGSDCTMCHDQQGFISFLETGELPTEPFSTVSGIGCFTCHNPHETGTLERRTVASVTLANGDVFDHGDGNLCVACHHARVSAESITDDFNVTSTHWGPHHGPQGDVINGSNGYEFPGLSYNFPSSPHANQVRSACIGCHMGNVTTHEGFDVGGHSWNMVSLTDENITLAAICSDGSCHPSTSGFDFAADLDYDNDGSIEGYRTEIHGLHDSLAVLLTDAGVLSGGGSPVVGTIANGHLAGALFNFLLVEEDRSYGVHNFNYLRSLLEASIDYVDGLATAPPATKTDGVLAAH